MRHRYWEWPIASYLFLGGLGGGIFCLAAIMRFFVAPDAAAAVESALVLPGIVALVALGAGCFLLVFELGQPFAFLRVFLKSTSIICWGARILTACLVFGFAWLLSLLPGDALGGVGPLLAPASDACLALAGITGACIMLYTGILLSSLKAHSFWATPALPVLFTVSALSTACAALTLAAGVWPRASTSESLAATALVHEVAHTADLVLVVVEIAVLLIMVLSFLGAGNTTAQAVARRWVKGKLAPAFWGGMVLGGLALPLALYVGGTGSAAASVVAPVLVLAGGLLLRFLLVYADDRREIPGEHAFFSRLPRGDERFLTAWYGKENLY